MFLEPLKSRFRTLLRSGVSQIPLYFLSAAFVASCASQPATLDDPSTAHKKGHAEVSQSDVWKSAPFESPPVYPALPLEDDPTEAAPATSSESATSTETVTQKPQLDQSDVILELHREAVDRWLTVSEAEGTYTHEDRLDAARNLITLSLLSSDQCDANPTVLRSAAGKLESSPESDDRILATLAFQKLGRSNKVYALLQDISETEPATSQSESNAQPQPAAAIEEVEQKESPRDEFRLASVTFATKIDGPGKFEAVSASQLEPGRDVLIYGEFENFLTVRTQDDPGDQPIYSREFSGRLRLTDPEGKILDELDFLPPGRGRQDVQDESEAVNFWARYTIPADLSAGKYTVVITAADLLQKVSAQARLNFKID